MKFLLMAAALAAATPAESQQGANSPLIGDHPVDATSHTRTQFECPDTGLEPVATFVTRFDKGAFRSEVTSLIAAQQVPEAELRKVNEYVGRGIIQRVAASCAGRSVLFRVNTWVAEDGRPDAVYVSVPESGAVSVR